MISLINQPKTIRPGICSKNSIKNTKNLLQSRVTKYDRIINNRKREHPQKNNINAILADSRLSQFLEVYGKGYVEPKFDPYSQWVIPDYSKDIRFRGYVNMRGLYMDYQCDDGGAGWAKSPLEIDFIREGLRYNVHKLWNRSISKEVKQKSDELYKTVAEISGDVCRKHNILNIWDLQNGVIKVIDEKVARYSSTIDKSIDSESKDSKNWIRASEKVKAWATSPNRMFLSPRDIKNLHKVLFEDIEMKNGNKGEYRKNYAFSGNQGNGQYYIAHQDIEKEMNQFCDWLNTGLKENYEKNTSGDFYKNPIMLASKAYERLVSIHPFGDGNGRVARLVLNFVCEKFNILPPILDKEDKGSIGGVTGMIPYNVNEPEKVVEAVMNGIDRSYKLVKESLR